VLIAYTRDKTYEYRRSLCAARKPIASIRRAFFGNQIIERKKHVTVRSFRFDETTIVGCHRSIIKSLRSFDEKKTSRRSIIFQTNIASTTLRRIKWTAEIRVVF